MAYGVPQNNVKRVFLLLKVRRVSLQALLLGGKIERVFSHLISFTIQAAYNIGGHTISADTMQSSILGCRMSRPGQVDPAETLKNSCFYLVPLTHMKDIELHSCMGFELIKVVWVSMLAVASFVAYSKDQIQDWR